jgi:hypothetical protein
MTPSELRILSSHLPISNAQIDELKRTNRHEKSRLPNPDLNQLNAAEDEPPNGGVLAWLQVLGSFFCTFNMGGLNMSFGTFQAFYQLKFLPNCSPSKTAWIGIFMLVELEPDLGLIFRTGSFQNFSVFFSGLVVGPLVDKGYFRDCFHGGSVMLVTSLVLTSFCKTWLQLFLTQGVWTGISMGIVFSTCIINITTHYSTQLGIVSGLAAAGASIGMASQYYCVMLLMVTRRDCLPNCCQGVA